MLTIIAFVVVGLLIGYRLDRKSYLRRIKKGDAEFGPVKMSRGGRFTGALFGALIGVFVAMLVVPMAMGVKFYETQFEKIPIISIDEALATGEDGYLQLVGKDDSMYRFFYVEEGLGKSQDISLSQFKGIARDAGEEAYMLRSYPICNPELSMLVALCHSGEYSTYEAHLPSHS